MSVDEPSPDYLSYVTLAVVGDDLDPGEVTRTLRLFPSQSWRRGEPMGHAPNSTYRGSGWKKSLPEAELALPLEGQLLYWVRELYGRAEGIYRLVRAGHECSLVCYIGSSGSASIVLPVALQKAVAALGLQLEISFFADSADADPSLETVASDERTSGTFPVEG
jgi:hypothetical protein